MAQVVLENLTKVFPEKGGPGVAAVKSINLQIEDREATLFLLPILLRQVNRNSPVVGQNLRMKLKNLVPGVGVEIVCCRFESRIVRIRRGCLAIRWLHHWLERRGQ